MAQKSIGEILTGFDLRRTLNLMTIPNMFVMFVVLLGVLHIIASLISGTNIADFGRFQTPVMLLFYAMVIILIQTVMTNADIGSLPATLSNKWTLLGFIIIFALVWWLSATGSELIPEVFSLVSIP